MPSFVISVTTFVATPKPAPSVFKLFAAIMSRCFFSSFAREFSTMFSVSIEKPHTNNPG